MLEHQQLPVPRMLFPSHSIDWTKMPTDQFLDHFCFTHEHTVELFHFFCIPATVISPCGSVISGQDCLLLMLKQLAFPSQYVDLVLLFCRQVSELCYFFNFIIRFVHSQFSSVIHLNERGLGREKLEEYAEVVRQHGGLYESCIGFIDGTIRAMCRPGKNQKVVFNGWKRVHCIKFQAFTTPDGILQHLSQPFAGIKHNSSILAETGLLGNLKRLLEFKDRTFHLYGDPAYMFCSVMRVPFRRPTEQQKAINKRMSGVRVPIEWAFGKITNNFAYLDFKRNLRLLNQPVGLYYTLGCFLSNCHTCYYGSETADYFGLSSPSIRDYLQDFI